MIEKVREVKKKVKEEEYKKYSGKNVKFPYDFFIGLRKYYINLHRIFYDEDYLVFNKEWKFLYIPVPKVANSSIRSCLLEIRGSKLTSRRAVKKSYRRKKILKFGFVRNPYDRLVSCYEDKVRNIKETNSPEYVRGIRRDLLAKGFKPEDSFKEFVKKVCEMPDKKSDLHFKSQYLFFTNRKGKIDVDFMGKFENLGKDYEDLCKEIGIKSFPRLPRLKKSKRKRNYRGYYDEETKRLVEERYKKDLELFGYSF